MARNVLTSFKEEQDKTFTLQILAVGLTSAEEVTATRQWCQENLKPYLASLDSPPTPKES